MPRIWIAWARLWGVTTARDPGGPQGIGGWLFIPIQRLWFGFVLACQGVYFDVSSGAVWKASGVPQTLIGVHLAVSLVLIVWAGSLFRDLIRRRRSFPTGYSVFELAQIAWPALVLAGSRSLGVVDEPHSYGLLLRDAAVSAIWVLYMRRSVRVRNTFVR